MERAYTSALIAGVVPAIGRVVAVSEGRALARVGRRKTDAAAASGDPEEENDHRASDDAEEEASEEEDRERETNGIGFHGAEDTDPVLFVKSG